MTTTETTTEVFGDARVSGNAQVSGSAWVADRARVFGNAYVFGDARVYGDAWVYGDARVSGSAYVYGDAWVYGDARVSGNAQVFGDAYVFGDAQVSGSAWVSGDAQVSGSADLRRRRHVLTVGPVGSKGRTVTIHRHYDGPESTHWGNLVNAGCWSGTLDALAARIAGEEHGWSDEDTGRYRADYEAVMFLARPRVAEWAAEPLTAEDHARWAVVDELVEEEE